MKFHSDEGAEASFGERWKEPGFVSGTDAERRDVAARPGSERLVLLQPLGSRRPLFFVHAAGGNVFSYVALARHLGQDQPFYALQARGIKGEIEPHTRVEMMAADYVAAMRATQAEGPYALGGWSLGGVIAFEMAQQLQTQGQQVALLVMFDSEAPHAAAAPPPENEQALLLAGFAVQLGLSLDQLTNVPEDFLSLDEKAQLKYLLAEAKRSGALLPDFDLMRLEILFRVFKNNIQACQSYQPLTSTVPLVLFRAAEKVDEGFADATLGWGRLARGPFEVEEVTGNHFTMLYEPHVSRLAEKLRARLAKLDQRINPATL